VKIRRLQTRIVVFFGLLMVGVQLVGLLLLHTVGVPNARAAIDQQLVVGERVFAELMKQRTSLLGQAAHVLAADYAFREALTSHDTETIVSALDNHGARIDAQVMMLVGLDGRVIADTAAAGAGHDFPLPALIAAARNEGNAAAIVMIGGRLCQVVVVPVAAPLPIGWVVMGFGIDDTVAHELHRITGLDVTFLARSASGAWDVQASTMSGATAPVVERIMHGGVSRTAASVVVDGREYLTRVAQQNAVPDDPVVAALQIPLDQALAPFRHLMDQFAALALIGILISMLASVAIARGIAGPMRQLAGFARRIAGGDYSDPPCIDREDEIGALSSAFEHMRVGIETREHRIMDLAYRDTLTGLPNRAMFTDRLQQAVAQARRQKTPLSVLVLDLDRFKDVNDTLGHHLGDVFLQQGAARLAAALRRESDTVARLGADEFAILLPATDVESARKVARKLQQAIEEPASLDGHLVDMHASIGITCFPDDGDDLAGLMRRADVAMYVAKRSNTGFAVYDSRYDEHTAARLSLMSELRKAVEHDELVVYYQPKIALDGTSPLCVEALIRWQHPQRGFIPPAEFIPFAEQTGYIRAITMWLLERVIAQMARWRADGLDIDVSINISARDLLNPDLPPRFASLMQEHGCSAASVCLEITESAILEDTTRAIDNLERLAALGCKLSIDDYGTGYSSLSYLKRLPVDELKIDRSFVINMTTSHDDRVIVQSTIDLAHNMGLSVTAEGVEDQQTLDRLRSMGCDMAQGFWMSKPIAATDLSRWIIESGWITAAAPVRLLNRA